MLDLFDLPPVVPGLATQPDLVTLAEERALLAAIDATDLTPFRFQGWTGKRLTTSFGWSYDYETERPERAPPIPEWLLPIRERVAAFAGLDPADLVQALLLRYGPGAGIGWHRDKPIYEHVVGLSLGVPADMRFRRRRVAGGFDRATLPLEPRAAYHVFGEARHVWEHSIVEMTETRHSITFRSHSRRGLLAAAAGGGRSTTPMS